MLVAIVATMLPSMSHSQAVSFLTLSPDAQHQAMGGTAVASQANAFAIYNNPASIALSESMMEAAVSYNMWQSGGSASDLLALSTYYKSGDRFGMGLSYRSIAKPSYDIYDDTGNYKGEFSPGDMAIDFALSYAITESLAVGATLKYISSELSDSYSGSAVGADIAVTYLLECATIAASFSNIGSVSYEELSYSLPSIFRVGGSYSLMEVGEHSCSANLEVDYLTSESALGIGVGAEYSLRKMIFGRLGYYQSCNDQVLASYLSAGLGVEMQGISLNWSYIIGNPDSSPLAGSMNLSLGYRF